MRYLLALGLVFDVRDDEGEHLIRLLGSNEPAEREQAQGRLIELGEKAERAVHLALRSSDPEVAGRARFIWDRLRDSREERGWEGRIGALAESFHRREYKELSGGKEVGRWVLTTRKEGDQLLLEDWIEGVEEIKAESIRSTITCATDRTLTLRKLHTDHQQGAITERAKAELLNGKFVGEVNGKKVEFEPRSPCVHWYALFRLIPSLPQKEGFTVPCEYVTYNAQHSNGELRCRGEKEVEWQGNRIRVWEWEFSDISHWVKDHRHLRMFTGGWDVVFAGPWP